MTAPSGSEPLSPFLSFVGPQDRNLLRFGLWLTLGLPLAVAGYFFVLSSVAALTPDLAKSVAGADRHRLASESQVLCYFALLCLAVALPFLGAARLAFQRPAWTFVSPARPFAPKLMLLGGAAYGLLVAATIGVDLMAGSKLSPPLADASQPVADRIVYALALPPLVLLASAAQELMLRGVFIQVAGAFVRTRIGICVVNGILSGLFPPVSQPNPLLFLDAAVTGAVFAYAVLELGGIEFTLGASFAANLLELLAREPSLHEKSAAFRWSDLLKPEVMIDIGEMTAVAVGTVIAVRLIKRYRKA